MFCHKQKAEPLLASQILSFKIERLEGQSVSVTQCSDGLITPCHGMLCKEEQAMAQRKRTTCTSAG